MRQQRGRRQPSAVHRDGIALFVLDLDIGRLGRRLLRRDAHLEDVLRRFLPGVLENPAFVADVKEILIGAVGLGLRRRHGNPVPLGVFDQLPPGPELPLAPGRDDPDRRVQGQIGHLEPHLIVALPRRPVRHRAGALALGDLDLPLGDERAGDGRAEQVAALIDGAGAQHGKDVVPDEGLAEILDVDLARAHPQGLGLDGLHILTLSEIGAERDDLAAERLLQPLEDHRRVEPARVGQDDFFDRGVPCSHYRHRSRSSRVRMAFWTWSRFSA